VESHFGSYPKQRYPDLMVKDSYPTAKLKAPLTRQGVEQLQILEEIARRQSAAGNIAQLFAHC